MDNKGKMLLQNIKSIISCDDKDSVYDNSYIYIQKMESLKISMQWIN